MAWLASDLLTATRRAAAIPSTSAASPQGLTDADLLIIGDEEIQTGMVPLVMSVREDFYLLKKSIAFTPSTKRLRIPSRTIAGRMRDVRCTIAGVDYPLVRLPPTDKPWIQPMDSGGSNLYGYYVEGEWLVFLPYPNQSGTLDVYYFGRPGRLTITAADYRAITVVGATSLTYATWSSGQSTSLDVVRGLSGFTALFQDLAFSGATSTSVTVSSTDAGLCEVGDYLVNSELTPVVPLPVELQAVLVQRCAVSVLRQLGRNGEADAIERKLERAQMGALSMLTPRVESQPQKVRGNLAWRGGNRGWWGL